MNVKIGRSAGLVAALALAASVLSAGAFAGSAAADVTSQTADVRGQGPSGPVVAEDGATLQRSTNGLSAIRGSASPHRKEVRS